MSSMPAGPPADVRAQELHHSAVVLDGRGRASAAEVVAALRELPGMVAVEYDAHAGTVALRYDAAVLSVGDLERTVGRLGGTLRVSPEQPTPLAPELGALAHLPLMARLTAACLTGVVLGSALEAWWPTLPWGVPHAFYALAYLTGGYFSVREAWRALRAHQFDVNFLMVAAALGAASIGYEREGAVLMFLFSLAGTLETYALGRTHQSIQALLDMAPKEATVERDGRELRVPVEELRVGDVVVVRPGGQIPADGRVVRGASSVNEASITGESLPVDKTPGDRVFAGTLNGQGLLAIEVSAPVHDSTLARIVELMRTAREQKARAQDFTDRVVGRYYAYAVVGITLVAILVPPFALGWSWTAAFYRAMTLMVVASPCALVISIPAAVLSALARSGRDGALFKGGAHLETAARVRVVVFDKTGTLTTGRFRVARVVPFGDRTEREVLRAAAAVEQGSEHPLAAAITAHARELGLVLPAVEEFEAMAGVGARARVDGVQLRVAKPARETLGPAALAALDALEADAHTVVVLSGSEPWGMIALADTVRPPAAGVVAALKERGYAVALLTGDNARAGAALGRRLGIDEVRAGLLPDGKVAAIRELRARYGPVAMVGDGVNDAPALAAADLGIAMGAAGTDAAIESADVLLMSDDVARIPPMFALAGAAQKVIRQNLVVAAAVVLVAMVLALVGILPLSLGVVVHEGSTLVVVANGLRLLAWR
jgi:Cd2+/Zn2+-exporting ATPase